jgi:hypothetical protein
MPDLDSDALDFRAASESFAPVRRLKRRDKLATHGRCWRRRELDPCAGTADAYDPRGAQQFLERYRE